MIMTISNLFQVQLLIQLDIFVACFLFLTTHFGGLCVKVYTCFERKQTDFVMQNVGIRTELSRSVNNNLTKVSKVIVIAPFRVD